MRQIRNLILAAAGIVCILSAAERYIGTANTEGSFWVDSAGVTNHATLFGGSSVEAGQAVVKLEIATGTRVLLDAGSRAQVFEDHLVLEKGRGELAGGSGYRLEARALSVSLGSAQSHAVVAIGDSGVVEVGALGGGVQVRNADGIVVAQVQASRQVELRTGEGGGQSVLTGCLSKMQEAFVLQDEASGVLVEARGLELSQHAGERVQLTGTADKTSAAVAPAAQVIQASEIKGLGTKCEAVIDPASIGSRERIAPPGVTATAGSAAAAGIGVSHAVMGGVAVATGTGTVAGVAAAKANKPPKPPHLSKGR